MNPCILNPCFLFLKDTEGFDIPCKIIHVAGPIWDAARAEECKSEIRQAVKSCLQLVRVHANIHVW